MSPYDGYNNEDLYENTFTSMRINTVKQGVNRLLDTLNKQMAFDENHEPHHWDPQDLGITVFQTFVNAQELNSSIWNFDEAVGNHFEKAKVVQLMPAKLPLSHNGWQFFMSGAGAITNPHIDPPLTRNVFWQVIGSKLWGTWSATEQNLAKFERTNPMERTWEWAVKELSEDGRRFFIMEPGTWSELKHSAIHACISLTPSVHAAQDFFHVDDVDSIVDVWKKTEEARKSKSKNPVPAKNHPEPIDKWLPHILYGDQNLDETVQKAIDLYKNACQMVEEGKSDEVTSLSELCDMLPLVRMWIKRYAQDLQSSLHVMA
jgi:hypothetical protein